jgi:transitional endoplasmic reticulum ATPase
MSHLLQRKQHHESQCEQALREGDALQAKVHATKAADYALSLAKAVTSESVAASYVADAEGWLEIAENISKAKLPSRQPSGGAAGGSKMEPVEEGANQSEWLVTEKPNIKFDQIAGMAEAKQSIREMAILPLQRPELTKSLGLKAGGGVLLYGPPGNGKTLLGKAIATELDAAFFYASGAQIRSKWHGESEKRLRKLLQAVKAEPMAVLFLDEVDGLLPKRGGNSAVDNRIVTQFLSEIGGFEESENTLLLLGATNVPWDIDDAVFRTGRFDEKIYIQPPDVAARLGIFQHHLKEVSVAGDIDLPTWAERMEGYTGSDIVGIVNGAKRSALGRAIRDELEAAMICCEDLERILKTIPPSANAKMLAKYERFAAR